MDSSTVAEMFDQIVSGEDIPKIDHLLKTTSQESASIVHDGCPYSILTNLAHADFWQQVWLARLEGSPRPKFRNDWRVPDPSEYPEIRKAFLANLKRASEVAHQSPLQHQMKSDDAAYKTLIALAIHTAYHIGQIKLIAQLLRGKD